LGIAFPSTESTYSSEIMKGRELQFESSSEYAHKIKTLIHNWQIYKPIVTPKFQMELKHLELLLIFLLNGLYLRF